MLRTRVIPVLNYRRDGLYKSVKFADYKYVGDPLNAVRIFNEKEVDELAFIDVSATTDESKPNLALLKRLARESRMPLSYGGGIKSVDDAINIISLGFEKIMLSSAALFNQSLLEGIAKAIGKQSIVVVLDYKMAGIIKRPYVFTHNGKRNTKKTLSEVINWLKETESVGEIVVNSIENDGTGRGYDLKTLKTVNENWGGPLIALGGCGSYEDINNLTRDFPMVAAGAASTFVFKGKYRAVLINYLERKLRK